MKSKKIFFRCSLQTIIESERISFSVRLNLANLRDSEPLLELDRDERKLEAFLQLHR